MSGTSPPIEKDNPAKEVESNPSDESTKTNNFGILDIRSDSIKTPPLFTEEATLSAMNKLGITPNDLVLLSNRSGNAIDSSDESGMKIKIKNQMEKKRLEDIEKIIAERNKTLITEETNVQIPKMVDETPDEIIDNNINSNNNVKSPRKKKKSKNKKKRIKRKITANENSDDSEAEIENASLRVTKRRKRKSNSPYKFQSNKSQELTKPKTSLPPSQRRGNPPTNRRLSVAERRQKYQANLSRNDKIYRPGAPAMSKDSEAKKQNDLFLVTIRVKANEERCRLEREEKQQLIKKQAQLRMQRLKGEETQFEKMKKNRKTKAEDEMKRRERIYLKLQEKKLKSLEQDKKKRQKIYNTKLKKDNDDMARFSKLKQKFIEAQNNPNHNFYPTVSRITDDSKSNDDVDLFSVTQPKNPKLITATNFDENDNSPIETESNSLILNENSTNKDNDSDNKNGNSNLPIVPKVANDNINKVTPKPKPVNKRDQPLPLSSSLNTQTTKKVQITQPKSRSSLQNPSNYNRLPKLPVVGKNKTRIPCLRR